MVGHVRRTMPTEEVAGTPPEVSILTRIVAGTVRGLQPLSGVDAPMRPAHMSGRLSLLCVFATQCLPAAVLRLTCDSFTLRLRFLRL